MSKNYNFVTKVAKQVTTTVTIICETQVILMNENKRLFEKEVQANKSTR